MSLIFYIQYDKDSYNLTNITSNDKSSDNDWIPVAISYSYQSYVKNNYSKIKYDPSNQRLIYPDEASRMSLITKATNNTVDNLSDTVNNNTQVLNLLKHRIIWNHVVGIYYLPDDFPFLNRNYSTPIPSGYSFNLSDFTNTGIYIVASNEIPNDGPKNVNLTNGFTFKILALNANYHIIKVINSQGVWITTSSNIPNWKQIISF